MQSSIKKNTVFNIIKTCSTIIFPLVTFPYVSRVLLPDNVGKVNFAASFITYFSLVASLGIGTYAIRECASVRNNKDELTKKASQLYSINIITTLIAYLLLFITMLFFRKLDSYRTLIIIQSTTIFFATIGADWINTAMEDFKYIALRTLVFQLLSVIAIFVFVKNQSDYIKYAVILVFSSSGANIANWFYRRKYCKIRFVRHVELKKHFSPILLLFVMMLSQTILHNTDITMLGVMWNDQQVGLYSTAYKVTNLVSSTVQSVILVVLPRLSYYFNNNDYKSANSLLKKLLSFNITVGFPCVVGVIMLSDDIIRIVGGSEYTAAAPLLRILILSFFFSLVGGSFLGNAILIPTKNEKYYMIVCCITAGFNIVLNAILIPFFAGIGASIATALNGLLILVLLLLKVDKRIEIPNINSIFISPIIGSIIIVIVCLICSTISSFWNRIICSVVFSGVMYILVLKILKNYIAEEVFSAISSFIHGKNEK